MSRESHLSIRVSPEEKAAWQKLADLQDVSLGQLVRRAVMKLAGERAPLPTRVRQVEESISRSREIGWLQTHAPKLQLEIPGQWVIIQGDELIAHGNDYLATLAEARQKGVTVPFVERIPERTDGVWMGL